MNIEKLKNELQLLVENPKKSNATSLFCDFIEALEKALLRSAYPPQNESDDWTVDLLVKKTILTGFKIGEFKNINLFPFYFSDKDNLIPLNIDRSTKNIRVVPGGTTIRPGVFLGQNTTIMPPAFINIGAYIAENTLIDSHALIGSCAQIGANCHISAAAQIGGVLEPVGLRPVIIEDNVFIGGNAGIYEATRIKKGAVIAAGTILTRSTRVYDIPNNTIIQANENTPLTIPENAVIVPGSRPIDSDFAKQNGLSIYTPIIIKYKDEKTSAATILEQALR